MLKTAEDHGRSLKIGVGSFRGECVWLVLRFLALHVHGGVFGQVGGRVGCYLGGWG